MVIAAIAPLQCLSKKKHAVNMEEARVSNYLFRKGTIFQINYVGDGSLKRIVFLMSPVKHTHRHTKYEIHWKPFLKWICKYEIH